MTMMLQPNETVLLGNWILDGNKVRGDEITQRIKYLISHGLNKVATDTTGWFTLYCDPEDDRLWELSYPQSGMHGGGPPRAEIGVERRSK